MIHPSGLETSDFEIYEPSRQQIESAARRGMHELAARPPRRISPLRWILTAIALLCRDQRAPDGSIRIEGFFPDERTSINNNADLKAWQKEARQKFVTDAEAIFNALSNNLPGGTLHELLILMLQHKVNLFEVKE